MKKEVEAVTEVKVKMGDKDEAEGVQVRLLSIKIIISLIHPLTFKRHSPPAIVCVLLRSSQRSRERRRKRCKQLQR